MPNDSISLRELVQGIIPKLKVTEELVSNTLHHMIQTAHSGNDRSRFQLLQQEFELELMMIHMNMKHLMSRYAKVIQDESDAGAMLKLDQQERFAIDCVMKLYQRVRAIQIESSAS